MSRVITVRLSDDLVERLDKFTGNRSSTVTNALEQYMNNGKEPKKELEPVKQPEPKPITKAAPVTDGSCPHGYSSPKKCQQFGGGCQ